MTDTTLKLRDPVGAQEKAHAERCACRDGRIEVRNDQDTVRCAACDTFLYCAPRVETGREVRSVTTVHNGVRPSARSRVIERATARCEMCGARDNLHVGHLVSVRDGVESGLTEAFLNDEENLAAMCAECNLGQGNRTVPLRLALAILRARAWREAAGTRRHEQREVIS